MGPKRETVLPSSLSHRTGNCFMRKLSFRANARSSKSKPKRVYENGVDLNLPIKVLELMELFVENRGEIVTKEMIISKLWATSQEYSEGSIRVYINQIKKLFHRDTILNIKGVGYKIEF